MSEQNIDIKSTSVKDVEQLGTFAALASLSYVFWICGGMEMIERLAFYGVRTVAGLYGRDSIAEGGLGLGGAELGIIFSIWAMVQAWVPVLTGGLSDRYGYKETIFASTVFKILGYLIMAWFASFWGFLIGAVVLAFGTGIFKPGLQGTIVKASNRRNSSVAWGVFYQTVNIGGFLGPIVAGYMRQLAWENVFYACAAIISINFLLLATYREPDKQARLDHRERVKNGEITEAPLWREALSELKQPLLIWYMVLFSGWWFMFYLYWDVGPLYFDDWVNTKTLVSSIWGSSEPSALAKRFWVMDDTGTYILPEGLINVNALLIMVFCFLIAGFSARLRAANSMAIGTFLAAGAFIIIGGTNAAWITVAAIAVFSVGEMLSSPKLLEYMGNIAPPDKKAMYLGFTQLPVGLGWTLEGFVGQYFYGEYASKDQVARLALAEKGWTQEAVNAVPADEAFGALVKITGTSADVLTQQLYTAHNVGVLFHFMAIVGIVAGVGLYIYGRWTYQLVTDKP
ncbi:MFS transporter [Kordiimonas aquimaris]|uniref:MFS transporter n=1 Tax=Kordiimonas aquimaris TaxID=707591 RepID=UPI0021D0C200|nr:MFS transporter [Kordiimonas aquimaris]